MWTHLTVDDVYTVPADVKLRTSEETPDSFNDQVWADDDEEGEKNKSVHFLSKFCLPALIVSLFLVPVDSDEQQQGQDEYWSLDYPHVQVLSWFVLLNLQRNLSAVKFNLLLF